MIYRFGAFELDDARFELRKSGLTVVMQRRVFDLLHFLVQRPRKVVTRAELLQGVWGGASVTKDAVAQAVTALRCALDDDCDAPVFVRTHRCRGYEFVAPVVSVTSDAEPRRTVPLASAEAIERDAVVTQVLSRVGQGALVLVAGASHMGDASLFEEIALRAGGTVVMLQAPAGGSSDGYRLTELAVRRAGGH